MVTALRGSSTEESAFRIQFQKDSMGRIPQNMRSAAFSGNAAKASVAALEATMTKVVDTVFV